MPSVNSNNTAVKSKLDRAIKLNRQGKSADAIRLFKDLLQDHPDSAAAHGYLAGIYFEKGDLTASAKHFRAASVLNPQSETASLGLFHSLWDGGWAREAVKEMRRFLCTAASPRYDLLLHDLAVEGRLVPYHPPAKAG
jgi:predicted Zn-dependent protease